MILLQTYFCACIDKYCVCMLCVFPYIIGSILLFVVSIEVYLGYDSFLNINSNLTVLF